MASDWFIARAVFRQASKNAFLLSRAQFHWFIYLHMNFFRNPQTMHATDNILSYGIFFSSFLVMWKRGGERGMHWPGWKYEWRVRELFCLTSTETRKFIRDGGKGMKESVKVQSLAPTRKTKMPWSAAITTKLRPRPLQELECPMQLLFQVLGWPGSCHNERSILC